jgi:hypothetical protein
MNHRLLFGPLAGLLLAVGVIGLGLLVPGYSQVHQTVSEIGEVGSPAQLPFTLLLCAVAACLVVFGWGVGEASRKAGHWTLAGWFIAATAISAAGVGIFSFPHPLHNVFGLSETLGYQAPLVLALTWGRDAKARGLVVFSWIMFVVVWIAIGLNMSAMDRHGAIWMQIRPVYGLVQRALFAAWFGWVAGVGLMLARRE